MEVTIHLLNVMLPMLYGMTTVNYSVYFVRQDPFAERIATPLLLAVVAVDWLYLLLRIFTYQHFPITTLGEALSLVALSVAVVYLYVERVQGDKATGVFIIAMVTLLQILGSTMLAAPNTEASSVPTDVYFGIHAVVAVVGFTGLAVGAIYGVMFLLLYRALKRKRFGLIFERLPSLDSMAKMGFGATFLGWIFLTVTILLGVFMSLQHFPDFYTDPKFITTLVVWAVYGIHVLTYFAFGWRGARLVGVGLLGFIFAIIAMFGSAYIWESFHSFLA